MMSQEDFLSNLHSFLSTPHYNELLRWNGDGTTINISLNKAICDYYFKELKLIDKGDVEDFIHRMERSGFMTVRRDKESITMAHSLLRKGQTLKSWGTILNVKGLKEPEVHGWDDLEELDLINQNGSRGDSKKVETIDLVEEPISIQNSEQLYERRQMEKFEDIYNNSPQNQLPPIEPPKQSPSIRIDLESKTNSQKVIVKTEENKRKSLSQVLGKLRQLAQEAPKPPPPPPVPKGPVIEIKEEQPVFQINLPEAKIYRAKKSCKEPLVQALQTKQENNYDQPYKDAESKQPEQPTIENEPQNGPTAPLKMYWRDQLYDILEKQKFPQILSWSSNGKLIVVKDEVKLRTMVLGRHLGRSKQFVVFNTQLINHKFKRYYSQMQGEKWYYKFYSHDFLKKGLTRWDWDQFRLSRDEWVKLRFERKNKIDKESSKDQTKEHQRRELLIEPPKELKRKTQKPTKYFKLLRQQSSDIKRQSSVFSVPNEAIETTSNRSDKMKTTEQGYDNSGQLIRIEQKVNDISSKMEKLEQMFSKVICAINNLKPASQAANEEPNNETMFIPFSGELNDPLEDSYPRI